MFVALERHPVVAYLALTFAISWGGILAICLAAGIPGSGEAFETLLVPVFLAMLAGPFLSALIMSIVLGGWAELVGFCGGSRFGGPGRSNTPLRFFSSLHAP